VARHSILVVDDDFVTREALRRQLQAAGFEVRAAEHGHEAMRLLQEGYEPDLIVTDLVMPLILGEQFIRRVRREVGLTEVPVVVLTGFRRAFADAALAAGATEVLEKPHDLPRLAETVKRLLGGSQP
jgi:CheY-like chemotaxis protein